MVKILVSFWLSDANTKLGCFVVVMLSFVGSTLVWFGMATTVVGATTIRGDVAGGDVAGGDVAGGDVAGGDVATGD